MSRHLLLFAILLSTTSAAIADDEPSTQAEREIAEANKLTLEAFERMECFIAGETPIPLKPTKDSKLRWSNPVVGRIYGNVFLWTDDAGRPAVATSIYKAYAPWNSLDVECSSLIDRPLTLTCDGRPIWTPQPSTIEWKPLPSPPKPAANPKTRLVQMRVLVRRFEARVDDRRFVKDSQVERELRPLSQPIYRYASPDKGLVDGGMFAFTVGTDPEAFLLLECRADEGGSQAWYYALARMDRDALQVRLDDKAIWHVDYVPLNEMIKPNNPYRAAPVPERE